MFKKSLMLAALVGVMAPMVAHSWTLTTRVNSAGGQLQVGSYAPQNKVSAVMRNYTTSPQAVAITASTPGWRISRVIKNGVVVATSGATYNTTVDERATQQVVGVSFAKNLFAVKVTAAPGGMVTTPGLRNLQAGTQKSFVFTPYKNRSLVTIEGLSSLTEGTDYTISSALPAAAGESVVLTINVNKAATLKGIFLGVDADAGAPQTALVNTLVTLNAAGSVNYANANPLTYSWTKIAGPAAVTLTGANTAAPTFTPAVLGKYTFKVTVSNGSTSDYAFTSVTVASSIADAAGKACGTCHGTKLTAWTAGTHGTNATMCSVCHVGSDTGAHPGTKRADIKFGPGSSSLNKDDYVGSGVCASCHADKYATFIQSGHNFKMNKVENGVAPVYPFSSIAGALENMPATTTTNTLGKPTSYSQVTYVVGGYGWKARWFDLDGYLVTGADNTQGVQYNLAYPPTNTIIGQGWSEYNSASNKKYNCGECHTTGWKYDADGYGQDGLKGMYGTWVEGGVSCEACHGAGKEHARTADKADITKVANARTVAQVRHEEGYGLPISCGECHTRDGERNIYGGEGSTNFLSAYAKWANMTSATNYKINGRMPASGGLSKHHQTGDELLGIDPDATGAARQTGLGKHLKAGVTCGTCHNPHTTTKFQDRTGIRGADEDCVSCHTVTFNNAAHGGNTNADCIKCHMPYLVKSAVQTGTNYAGVKKGDIRIHIFKIDLSKSNQFNTTGTAGTFVAPWLTKEYACGTCHGTASNAPGVTTGIAAITGTTKVHGTISFNHANSTFASQQGVVPEKGTACATCHKAGQTAAVPVLADDYVGSATCGACHPGNYATFVKSGHNFKMNKVVNGAAPVYPFSNITGALSRMPATTTTNALGKPTAWSQTTYVVGGYGWKARWFDANGFLVTSGTQGVQYNLADGSWSSYAGTNKPYNCGECHVTGWKYVGATGAAAGLGQDGLPGMQGTWTEPGVACESCHGAGKEHAQTSDPSKITRVATGRTIEEVRHEEGYGLPVSCRECHTRDGERNIYGGEGSSNFQSAFNRTTGDDTQIGGRIRYMGHHETGDELLGVLPVAYDMGAGYGGTVAANTIVGKHLPAGVTCGTCHNPHKTTKYQDISGDGLGVDKSCTSCHSEKASFTVAAHTGLDCISCHMPKLTKSAINTTTPGAATGKNLAAVSQGDIKTHIFKIRLDLADQSASAPQYPGGPSMAFTMPWITKEYACGSCHADVAARVGALPGGKVH